MGDPQITDGSLHKKPHQGTVQVAFILKSLEKENKLVFQQKPAIQAIKPAVSYRSMETKRCDSGAQCKEIQIAFHNKLLGKSPRRHSQTSINGMLLLFYSLHLKRGDT